MANTRRKDPNVDSLTVGIIVESLKPSHFRSVIGTGVTIVIVVFSFGFWVAQMKSDLDMKAHLIRDNEERIKDAEEQGRLQRRVDALESAAEKGKYELSVGSQRFQGTQNLSISSRPTKERVVVRVAPKSD